MGYSDFGMDKKFRVLENINKIVSNETSFAAITNDKNILDWDDRYNGGNTGKINDKPINVKDAYSNPDVFVALKDNGEIISWGNERTGGKYEDTDIIKVFHNDFSFSAQKSDSSIFDSLNPMYVELKQLNNWRIKIKLSVSCNFLLTT